jgi:hypothetical protein
MLGGNSQLPASLLTIPWTQHPGHDFPPAPATFSRKGESMHIYLHTSTDQQNTHKWLQNPVGNQRLEC